MEGSISEKILFRNVYTGNLQFKQRPENKQTSEQQSGQWRRQRREQLAEQLDLLTSHLAAVHV